MRKIFCLVMLAGFLLAGGAAVADDLGEKFIQGIGELSDKMRAGGDPAPILTNEETLALVKDFREKLGPEADKYTDLQLANLVGVMGAMQFVQQQFQGLRQ